MFKIILILTFSAICCTGQRRWAGSYGRTHSGEDRVTWDDRNYKRSDEEISTEGAIRYDHNGKWPADNFKDRDTDRVNSAPRNPPILRDEYDSRIDKRPTGNPIIGVSQVGKKIYPSTPGIGDERQYNHPLSEEGYDGRHRGDVNYKGYRETTEMQGSNYDRTRYASRGNVSLRDRPKIIVENDNGEEGRINKGNNDAQKKNSREDTLYYTGTTAVSKQETPKIEEAYDTRQRKRNNKADTGKAFEELPLDLNQKSPHPMFTESYNRREDTADKEYDETQRPKNFRTQHVTREYVRPIAEAEKTAHEDGLAGSQTSRFNTNGRRQGPREDTIHDVANYDRTIINSKQNQERQCTTACLKGDYGYDRQHDEVLRAREYDRRREEELKRKEYERRLEEEIRKRAGDRDDMMDKEKGNTRMQDDVRERDYDRKERKTDGNEHGRNEDTGIEERTGENTEGVKFSTSKEDHSDSEYISRGMTHTMREETNRRRFEIKSEENLRGRDTDWRKDADERNIRRKGEEKGLPTYHPRVEDKSGHRYTKGMVSNKRQEEEVYRREVVRDFREEEKPRLSGRRQDERTERREYSGKAKGEPYDRESDYFVKTSNYDSRSLSSRTYDDSMQRTTTRKIDEFYSTSISIKGYGRRQDDRNRTTEPPLVQYITESSLRTTENSARKNRNLRNHETNQPNISSNRRINRDSRRETTHHRNSEESVHFNFESTPIPSYADINDRFTRTSINREETIEEFSSRHNERTVPKPHFSNPVYKNRDNAERQSKEGGSRQSSDDNWKSTRSPPDIHGYHPNVSYDAIVFVDYEDKDETDDWNLPDGKSGEENEEVNNYKREQGGEIREKTNQRRRNKRSSIERKYSQTEEIHPDVEILPGYGITRQLDRRNYNDEVIDDEVELFSEKEIKVNTRDGRVNLTSDYILSNKNGSVGNRTSIEGRHHQRSWTTTLASEEKQSSASYQKENFRSEIPKMEVSPFGAVIEKYASDERTEKSLS